MDDVLPRFLAAADQCRVSVFGNLASPADRLAELAGACAELGIDQWDGYGERGAVARVEEEVAGLLGKPAAAFFVSGTMAQQAVLRVWCDRRRSPRVALPDLAHQLHHEADGPRLLHGFRFEMLTTGPRTATAEDLRSIVGAADLGAVQLELPLREAGCLLPSWDDLIAVSSAAREFGVPLHVDGARLWESQPFYDRPLAEICDLFDSVYVSFYKGLGGLAGAAVAAEEDVVAELLAWRRRMGGTLYRMTPYAVGALVGLRDRLPRMGECVAWARAFAGELTERGLRVRPDPPHTNTFQVFAEEDADAVNERLLAFMADQQIQPGGLWRPGDAPRLATTEVAVSASALEHDPATVADWWATLARSDVDHEA